MVIICLIETIFIKALIPYKSFAAQPFAYVGADTSTNIEEWLRFGISTSSQVSIMNNLRSRGSDIPFFTFFNHSGIGSVILFGSYDLGKYAPTSASFFTTPLKRK